MTQTLRIRVSSGGRVTSDSRGDWLLDVFDGCPPEDEALNWLDYNGWRLISVVPVPDERGEGYDEKDMYFTC